MATTFLQQFWPSWFLRLGRNIPRMHHPAPYNDPSTIRKGPQKGPPGHSQNRPKGPQKNPQDTPKTGQKDPKRDPWGPPKGPKDRGGARGRFFQFFLSFFGGPGVPKWSPKRQKMTSDFCCFFGIDSEAQIWRSGLENGCKIGPILGQNRCTNE